jgi:hypothetical protein
MTKDKAIKSKVAEQVQAAIVMLFADGAIYVDDGKVPGVERMTTDTVKETALATRVVVKTQNAGTNYFMVRVSAIQ